MLFELYLVKKILKYFLLSPIYIYITFSTLSLITSVLYFYFFENKYSLYNLDFVSENSFLEVIKMYLIALNSFLLGTIIFYDLSTKKSKLLFNKSFTDSLFHKFSVPTNLLLMIRVLFALIIVLYFTAYGTDILIRNDYLPNTNRALIVIIKIFSFILILLLGILHQKNKMVSNFYLFLLILISLGTGSRTVFLFVITYFIILFISNGNTLKNKLVFSINLIISFLFLVYLMQLRGLPSHGIIPYLKNLSNLNQSFLGDFYFNIYYSLIFGTYVTIKTVQEAQFDWNIIFISINPLPGSMAGWYKYANDMRLNQFAPYSLHGRIFKMGIPFIITYFFMTGILFSYIEKKIRFYLVNGKKGLAFIIALLLTLHIIYGFEYNLRSAFRYIYYGLFIVLLEYLFGLIKPYLYKKIEH